MEHVLLVALGSALVDRARRISQQPTAVKVEGTTQHSAVTGPWFRCRLTIPPRPETTEPAGGRTRVESRPTLMYEPRDSRGDTIGLTVEDKVEVDSPELGLAVYRLDGDPQPMRKRRSVIGFEVTLRRVEDHESPTMPGT